MHNVRCAVLLAAYNGEKYIKEQISSILTQKSVHVDIYVSDDGSLDNTVDIIKSIGSDNIYILDYCEGLRSASKNFFRLLRDVDLSSYEYVCFSDQDDIWKSDKIASAINIIIEKGVNAVSSNVYAFWQDGKTELINKCYRQQKYDYIFESAGPGCTYMFDKKIAAEFSEFIRRNWSKLCEIELHDWLIYLWARSNEYKWWIDAIPTVYYRQHDNNVFGARSSLKSIVLRWEKLSGCWYRSQILKMTDLLGLDHLIPVRLIRRLNYADRIMLAFSVHNYRRRFCDRIVLSMAFFLMRK